MRGRDIPSPSALTSTSLTSASFPVLPLPPFPPTVIPEAGSIVVVAVSPTSVRPPQHKRRIGGQTIPLASKATEPRRRLWRRIEASPPPPPPPRSSLPPLLLPFLLQKLWRERGNIRRRRRRRRLRQRKHEGIGTGTKGRRTRRGLIRSSRSVARIPPRPRPRLRR